MIKGLFLKIKELIIELFDLRRIVYMDVVDEYSEVLNGIDVSVRDTLVGTVRSLEQYEINIKNNFYYIPDCYLSNPDSINYIALYRSKRFYTDNNPGVIHYGTVLQTQHLKRSDIREIPNSFNLDDLYYRFEVDKWQALSSPISAGSIGINVCIVTNHCLLHISRYLYELYIADNDMLILSFALNDIINGVYDGFFIGECRVRTRLGKIMVFTPKKKFSFNIRDYKRYPLDSLTKIYNIVYVRNIQL